MKILQCIKHGIKIFTFFFSPISSYLVRIIKHYQNALVDQEKGRLQLNIVPFPLEKGEGGLQAQK